MSTTYLALFETLGDPGIKRPAPTSRCVIQEGEEKHAGNSDGELAGHVCAVYCETSWEKAELLGSWDGLVAGVLRFELGLPRQDLSWVWGLIGCRR